MLPVSMPQALRRRKGKADLAYAAKSKELVQIYSLRLSCYHAVSSNVQLGKRWDHGSGNPFSTKRDEIMAELGIFYRSASRIVLNTPSVWTFDQRMTSRERCTTVVERAEIAYRRAYVAQASAGSEDESWWWSLVDDDGFLRPRLFPLPSFPLSLRLLLHHHDSSSHFLGQSSSFPPIHHQPSTYSLHSTEYPTTCPLLRLAIHDPRFNVAVPIQVPPSLALFSPTYQPSS